MMRPALVVLALLATLPVAAAETLKVPSDKPTIAAAIADALPGDTILVSAGTYAESITLTGAENLTVRAKGKVFLSGGGLAVRLEDCTDVTVRGFRVDSGSGMLAVLVTGSSACTLEKLTVTAAFIGVEVIDSTDITVRDCDLLEIEIQGVFATGCTGLLVEDNTIDGDTLVGIQLGEGGGAPVTASEVSRNVLRGCSQTGILAVGGDQLLFERNVVEDGAGTGIRVGLIESTQNATILRNTVRDMGDDGIVYQGGSHVIERNKLKDLGGNAIYMVSGGTGAHQVLRNTVLRAVGTGIETQPGSPGDLIEGNTVKDVADDGIRSHGDATQVLDNLVKGSEKIGFVVAGSAGVLTDNRARTTGGNAWEIETGGHVLTDNRATKAGGHGYRVLASGNTFTGNKAKQSGEYGLSDIAGGNMYADNVFDSEDPDGLP